MISDLLLEAVENSVEAGAGCVEAWASLEDGLWRVRVMDDGMWDPSVTPFTGESSKGEGRGRGLCKIRSAAESCSLEVKDRTVLDFSIVDDHSLDDLFSAALSLILWPCHIRLVFRRGGSEKVLDSEDLMSRESYPLDAAGISGFKRACGREA